MGIFYKYSAKAYGYRRAGKTSGPLIIAMHTRAIKASGKEIMLPPEFIDYLYRLNPDPDAIKHILSKSYGPSKGIQKNGKLRFITAAYPGPGVENLVLISKLSPSGKWGMVEGLPEDRIPSMDITHHTHRWLIHRVYGSNRNGTAVLLKDEILVPVMSSGRWIEMKYLERIGS